MPVEGVVESGVPIATAATALGITPEAVRKRVTRGTLEAFKKGGQWRVILPENRPVSGSPGSTGGESVQALAEVDRAEALATYAERIIGPWAAQVADLQAKVIDQAEALGRLRAELAAAEKMLAERVESTSTTPRRWWQVWR